MRTAARMRGHCGRDAQWPGKLDPARRGPTLGHRVEGETQAGLRGAKVPNKRCFASGPQARAFFLVREKAGAEVGVKARRAEKEQERCRLGYFLGLGTRPSPCTQSTSLHRSQSLFCPLSLLSPHAILSLSLSSNPSLPPTVSLSPSLARSLVRSHSISLPSYSPTPLLAPPPPPHLSLHARTLSPPLRPSVPPSLRPSVPPSLRPSVPRSLARSLARSRHNAVIRFCTKVYERI